MATVDDSEHRPHIPPMYRSLSQPKPKGILKNAPNPQAASVPAHSLQWDEENLALTEVQKDSLMKITEPKTPYVRYNADTDEIEGEIPNLDLGRQYESPPQSPQLPSPTGADTSGASSRRTSFSSAGRPSRRSASSSSSRSTSFSLPNDSKKDIQGDTAGDIEVEDELTDEEAQKKHAEFLKARGRHYSNEAQAMKRAKELMQREDDDEELHGSVSRNEQKGEEDQGVTNLQEEGMNARKPSMNGV